MSVLPRACVDVTLCAVHPRSGHCYHAPLPYAHVEAGGALHPRGHADCDAAPPCPRGQADVSVAPPQPRRS
jgi:hypothetical protein